MNYKVQDQSIWKRKQQFDFYRSFSEPFFGISVDIDITHLYQTAKRQNHSIFLSYLHHIMTAVNDVVEFKYRISGDEVRIYDSIGVSATVARENETFGFSYIPFDNNPQEFTRLALNELQRVKQNDDFSPAADDLNLIHFSSIPWVKFTSLSHARHLEIPDSIPKISTGKIYTVNDNYFMPLSVHVHHGLMDAIHVSRLIDTIQQRTA